MLKVLLLACAIAFFVFMLMDSLIGSIVSLICLFTVLFFFIKSVQKTPNKSSKTNIASTKQNPPILSSNTPPYIPTAPMESEIVPPKNITTDPTAHNPYIFNSDYISSCKQKFIAFDVETTGLDPIMDRIIEISAVVFEDFIPTQSFSTLINPGRPIPLAASKVNGIQDFDVASAPNEHDAILSFCNYIGQDALNGDIVLVAHNALFDIKFLLYALSRNGIDADICFQDTLYMARHWDIDLPNYKLGTIAQYYKIDQTNAHRAEDDARVCGEIFCKMLQERNNHLISLFDSLNPIEQSICLWFKNILIESDCNTDLLTFSLSSSGYLSINCVYTVIKSKPKAKRPYILLPSDIVLPAILESAPATKSEGSEFIRVFFNVPSDLDPIKDQIIGMYQKVFDTAASYVSSSDRNMKSTAQSLFNQITV